MIWSEATNHGCKTFTPPFLTMYYIYALKHPKTSLIYLGYTDDLIRRCREHQKDKPKWELIYYEAYLSNKDAHRREMQLKNYGSALGHLRKRIYNSFRE